MAHEICICKQQHQLRILSHTMLRMHVTAQPPCQGKSTFGRSVSIAYQTTFSHLSRSRSLTCPVTPTQAVSSACKFGQLFRLQHAGKRQCVQHNSGTPRLRPLRTAAFDVDALALDIPDIDGDINSVQFELGAVFNEEGVALSFNNHREALEAAQSGVALVDLSHWGRLRITGGQRMAFLQHQGTYDIAALKPGQGCDTTFLTSEGAVSDFATALVSERNVLLLTSPETSDFVQRRFALFANPNDDVQVHDVSSKCAMMALVGPGADAILQQLGGGSLRILGAPPGSHQLLAYKQNAPVLAVAGTCLGGPGYTLVVDETIAGEVYALFVGKGCVPMGQDDWESACIQAGRPKWSSELAVNVAPHQAGLAHTLSPAKRDRYIGKEVLQASLQDSAKHPNHHLVGLRLSGPLAVGSPITSGMDTIGLLTSTAQNAEGDWLGLGYVLCAVGETSPARFEGAGVAVGGTAAQVRPLPFASWIADPVAFVQAAANGGNHSKAPTTNDADSSMPEHSSGSMTQEKAVASGTPLSLSPADQSEQSAASPRELNHWRLVVDRSMSGLRGARVVDIGQIQRDTRS